MSGRASLNGHAIYYDETNWRYQDNNEIIDTKNERRCYHCGKETTKEGHDACLGTLIGVMNACCGHGNDDEAYVQFLDESCIRGKDAVSIMKILKKYS